jgi:hypothetical protein
MAGPLVDGNHRLAAASYRCDKTIHAEVGGFIEDANLLFKWIDDPLEFIREYDRMAKHISKRRVYKNDE